jgi:PEP-CTERM motif-containing protein
MKTLFLMSKMFLLGLVPGLAWAGAPPGTAPEPGTFELLALGGVVALVIAIRNRRNRK